MTNYSKSILTYRRDTLNVSRSSIQRHSDTYKDDMAPRTVSEYNNSSRELERYIKEEQFANRRTSTLNFFPSAFFARRRCNWLTSKHLVSTTTIDTTSSELPQLYCLPTPIPLPPRERRHDDDFDYPPLLVLERSSAILAGKTPVHDLF